MDFSSGTYFSHYSEPAVTNANTRVMCGQYGSSYSNVKVRVTDYGAFTANTPYYFRFPLLKNPSGASTPLTYRVRLLSYLNSKHHPIVYGEYQYYNLQQTVSGSTSSQAATMSSSGNTVQSSVSISLSYSSYNAASGTNLLVKLKNNAMSALTDISALASLFNSNYNYEYYPNINLCVFRKANSVYSPTLALGSLPTSLDQQSYTISYLLAYPSTSLYYSSSFSGSLAASSTLSYRTSWTSSSFTRLSGLTNTNSMGVYQLQWSTSSLILPEGSHILVTLSCCLQQVQHYCKAMSGFADGAQPTSNLICRRQSSTSVYIGGYSQIAASTTLSITLYLQVTQNSLATVNPTATIAVISSSGSTIISAPTAACALPVTQYGGYTLALPSYTVQPIMKGTAQQLYFSFTLRSHTLSSGDYLVVDLGDWTVDPGEAEGLNIWEYKIGSGIYWVPAQTTSISSNKF